jgi:hypothetical protein
MDSESTSDFIERFFYSPHDIEIPVPGIHVKILLCILIFRYVAFSRNTGNRTVGFTEQIPVQVPAHLPVLVPKSIDLQSNVSVIFSTASGS